ncbi:Phosphatidylinositol (PI) 3-kinase [Blastocladiella emersonii ATCC 22665]|nr:Phosphatidylinositol (PI) 3-kinase [Blastocladiella emersonii ATCC 22665]
MAATSELRDFSYAVSTDLAIAASVKIDSLQGFFPRPTLAQIKENPFREFEAANEPHDLYVTVELRAGSNSLFLPSKTGFSVVEHALQPNASVKLSEPGVWRWSEWVTLPRRIRDLPLDAELVFTVWNTVEPRKHAPVGHCTLRFFDAKGLLQRGSFRLPLITQWDPAPAPEPEALENLEAMFKRFECGDLGEVEWLDKLALAELESARQAELKRTRRLYLHVDLPRFDFTVVYNEIPLYLASDPLGLASTGTLNVATLPETPTTPAPSTIPNASGGLASWAIQDPEIGQENLVESKHRTLARSHRTGFVDRNLKPNSKMRDELMTIVSYAPTQQLTVAEKDLVWNYRYYLSKDKNALTKFLKSVTWTDATECKQAVELMQAWASPDIDDALELLGPEFENGAVRSYAVSQLQRAGDEELSMYLLQLVQALKFDESASRAASEPAAVVNLAEFLISRAAANPNLGSLLHWYLLCETSGKAHGAMYKRIQQTFSDRILALPDGIARQDVLFRQEDLVRKLTDIAKEIRMSKETRLRKVERLREQLSDPRYGLLSFPPLPLPLDPAVHVTGIVPGRVKIFNSALMPLLLVFQCTDGTEYPVIFKVGDDLRQDQLVIQIVNLMDKLLQKENLDLKLTPYKVLATGPDQGFVQFIPSMSLAAILADCNNSLQVFLRKHNSDDSTSSSYGISANAMDTYVRSCAGYCVITYLLGVGDRHLDNLLMTGKGNLFHIDFGYILGRDPKPFPPPMKLCKEMVEAMGGAQSVHYQRFQSYAFVAYSTLRKSANLILNLLNLMVDASITDIAMEPDKAVVKVQDKFRLDLGDEDAAVVFAGVVADSVNALFPQVMETIHKWAQYWRR